MKQRKLLLAALTAAMTVTGGGDATAKVTGGASVQAGDNYFLYNVGAGKYLTNGLNWGTRASVDNAGRVIKLTANGSGFTVHTQNYSSPTTKPGYLTTNGYVDTGESDCNWVFEPVTIDGYTNAYRIKVADNAKDKAGKDNNGKYLTFVPKTTAVDPTEKVDGNNSVWILVPLTQRQTDGDYTYLLQNTDFNCQWEQKFWTGITYTNKDKDGNDQTGTNGTTGGDENNRIHEFFNMNYDISQAVTGLPAGTYKLSCQGFYRGKNIEERNGILYMSDGTNEKTQTLVSLFSESKAKLDKASGITYFNNGYYVANSMSDASKVLAAGNYENFITITVADNANLTIGVKMTTSPDKDWTVIDNFKLEKVSADNMKAELEAKISEAENISKGEDATANETLTSAINKAKNVSGSTADEYAAAVRDLSDAIIAYNSLMSAETEYANREASAEAKVNNPSFVPYANEAIKTALATAKATTKNNVTEYNYAAKTLSEAESSYDKNVNSYSALSEAIRKCVQHKYLNGWSSTFSATLEKANELFEAKTEKDLDIVDKTSNDLVAQYRENLREMLKNYTTATVHIKNANIENKDEAGKAYAAAADKGWNFTTNPVNKGVSAKLDSKDCTGIFMENWSGNGLNGDISQKITNLPKGKYFFKMAALTRNAGVNDYIFVKTAENTVKGAIILPGTPSNTVTDIISIQDGTAEVGLHVEGSDWAAWNAVELYVYSIDDQTRTTATGKYGTICLPYNATVDGAKLYQATIDETNNVVNLTEVTGNTVKKGVAYIYEATAGEQTFKFANDDNLVKDPETEGVLTGVFAQQLAPVNSYVLQQHSGETVQKFYKVTDAQPTLNAYRAYLNAPATANAKAMAINFDNATGINVINALTEGNAVIYDLNGNRLSKLQHGINIVNGVKVVIK